MMKQENKKTERIIFCLPAKVEKELKKSAKKEGVCVSAFITKTLYRELGIDDSELRYRKER